MIKTKLAKQVYIQSVITRKKSSQSTFLMTKPRAMSRREANAQAKRRNTIWTAIIAVGVGGIAI